jgi:hypothetical protein
MSLGYYSPVPSEKSEEDSVGVRDTYLSISRTTMKIEILQIILVGLLSILAFSIVGIIWICSLLSNQKCLDPQTLSKDTAPGLLNVQSFFPPSAS